MRVCLDTNVLAAAFATRGTCADVLRTVLADHEHVLGEVLLDELRGMLEGKLGLPSAQVETVMAATTRGGVNLARTTTPRTPRAPRAPRMTTGGRTCATSRR